VEIYFVVVVVVVLLLLLLLWQVVFELLFIYETTWNYKLYIMNYWQRR